jgi:EmrB/QacA subfamily drug resistance transporter
MAFVTEANRKWWTLGAVAFSLFMIMLDNTIVAVALPAVQTNLGSSVPQLEWILNAYVMSFSVLLLTGGRLADLFGRRRVFMAGLGLFTASSLWCGVASSAGMLIAARAVQGCGAALMLPATVAIISATFSVRERGLALGIWSGISGAGLALGPLIGGALVEGGGWRWIFYVNVPVGILGAAAAWLLVRESSDASAERRLDLVGLLSSGAAIFLAVFALIEANRYGWGSTLIVLCFAGSALALAVFVAVETRQRAPMLDVSLFKDPTYAGANVAGLLVMVALFGFIFFLSLYLQRVLGYSPLKTGVTFLSATGALMLTAPIAGKLSDEVGPRWPMSVGMALFGLAFVFLHGVIGVGTGFWDMFPWLVLGGVGFGMVMPPATSAVLASVRAHQTGVASGAMQALRQFGGGLGVAIMGAIMAAQTDGILPTDPSYRIEFVHGFRDVLLLAAAVTFAGSLVALLAVRRHVSLLTAFDRAEVEPEPGRRPAPPSAVPAAQNLSL